MTRSVVGKNGCGGLDFEVARGSVGCTSRAHERNFWQRIPWLGRSTISEVVLGVSYEKEKFLAADCRQHMKHVGEK